MHEYAYNEIAKLQDNLFAIRKAGGWSAEEFGNMIGVTKQTISNLEKGKTPLSKAQYIAIRVILEYELTVKKDDFIFVSIVNLCLNSNELTREEVKKASAFLEGAKRAKLDRSTLIAGLSALTGVAVAGALLTPATIPALGVAGAWITKFINHKD